MTNLKGTGAIFKKKSCDVIPINKRGYFVVLGKTKNPNILSMIHYFSSEKKNQSILKVFHNLKLDHPSKQLSLIFFILIIFSWKISEYFNSFIILCVWKTFRGRMWGLYCFSVSFAGSGECHARIFLFNVINWEQIVE